MFNFRGFLSQLDSHRRGVSRADSSCSINRARQRDERKGRNFPGGEKGRRSGGTTNQTPGKPRAGKSPRGSESGRTRATRGRGKGGPAGHPQRARRPRRRGARTPRSAPETRASKGGAGAEGEQRRRAQGRDSARLDPCARGAASTEATGRGAGGTPRHARAGAAAHPSRSEGRAWRAGKGAATERAAPRRERIHFLFRACEERQTASGGPPPKRAARCRLGAARAAAGARRGRRACA